LAVLSGKKQKEGKDLNRTEYLAYAKNGLVNRGNWRKIQECMKKAQEGHPVTIGFLGGSITQGSLSSTPETCYAYLVFDWWRKKFPGTQFTYVNAGIGGTTSQFGVARVKKDLLVHKPDIIIVEFSVNDESTDFFEETYEGLLRTILKNSGAAVMVLHNICYETGLSAENKHLAVAAAYGIPCVSMKSSLYRAITDGLITVPEISPDGLHPNDLGHRFVADTIIYCLEEIFRHISEKDPELTALPSPLTKNRYEEIQRLQNYNCNPEGNGFIKDVQQQQGMLDVFRNGWSSAQKGAFLKFRFEGTSVSVQYRKSVSHPAPVAVAFVDGDEEHAVSLDANFEETWGDCLFISNVAQNLSDGFHTLLIQLTEVPEHVTAEFYLVSILVSKKL
jgi:lysophospholipase L1-like esterase